MSRRVTLVQMGLGGVGSAVARLVLANRERWRQVYDLDIRYAAVLDTRGGVVEHRGLADAQVESALAAKAAGLPLADAPGGEAVSVEGVIEGLTGGGESVVLVDCAAGDGTYGADLKGLERGSSLVLSNKAPLSVSQERYDRLVAAGHRRLWYEATVGAGLPVISTLCSLLDTGDKILEIQACASGTLAYITSELMNGRRYSEAVRRARERGYTEPDPRDDLSGLDVARKALILARTFGRRMELADVRVEPLLPALDPELGVEEFMDRLETAGGEFEERADRARREGMSLRYVARVPAQGEVTVCLEAVPSDSQIGALSGPDNIFMFRTREYTEHPLTVIGPGAGPANTAMGVITDVLQAARS